MRAAGLIYEWQYRARQWAVGRLCRLRGGATATDPPSAPSRVLVVMTGLIGDTVMSTPLIVEARRLWPAAHITLLGRRHNCELLAACPLLDARYEAPAIPFSLRKRRELARLDAWLRAQNFDVALIALGDQFAAALARARIPVRVGVRGHALEPCLTHTYSIGSPREWGPHERLNALRSLGYEVGDAAPRLWVADEARRRRARAARRTRPRARHALRRRAPLRQHAAAVVARRARDGAGRRLAPRARPHDDPRRRPRDARRPRRRARQRR